MKIVTQRDGKHTWIALKDNNGIYHCLIDDSHQSKSFILAAHLYLKEDIKKLREMLKKEGYN